ncbi:hypothetical protein ACIBCH_09775 [Amycolatopsis thailandensis]|uniref:hypothetical protein n=1 Tax=Amycolatopsis thailandensis TaxID=589330 RepID=UPI0037A5A363
MTDSDARLLDMFEQHCIDTEPDYRLTREAFERAGHRIASPVEPCSQCGQRVYLFLAAGWKQPKWLQLGQIEGKDTLFPKMTQKRHTCGDGDSWSVEAVLFVESAMREWGLAVLGEKS